MPTPTHTDFDPTKPDGADDGPDVVDDILANLLALRDEIILGFVEGFVQTRTNGTGTAAQPQFVTWTKSALSLVYRWEITWTGFNPTTIAEEWSNDNGSTFSTIATHVLTFDGSQNVTASTNGGGVVVILAEAWAKTLKVTSDFATHTAATGASVHGLGTASTANLASMAISGTSSFDGSGGIGQATPMKIDAIRVREKIDNGGSVTVVASGGTFTPDVSVAAYFKIQPNSTTTTSMTIAAPINPPSSSITETITFEIVNGLRSGGGAITWKAIYHWIGGSGTKPADSTLEASGSNLYAATWNGASWDLTHRGKRG